MRNLKKFLALVLAMMMTLSLMVTANATNVEFGDSEKVTEEFQEDITVLTGMGVIKGVTTEEFQPTALVTRAEMAAILYRLVTGDAADTSDDLHAEYGSFKDVASDKWYAGYVGYCANARLIIGYGDGTFRPSNPVTGYEALVMLLRAMGYDRPDEFSKSDWRTHAASIATQRGLLDKINTTRYQGTLSHSALREVVAEMAFQAATKRTVEWTAAFGYQLTDITGENPNPTLGYLNYGLAWANSGVIVGNQDTGESVTRVSFPVDYDATGFVYAYGPVSATMAGGYQTSFAAVNNALTGTPPAPTAPAINEIGTFRNNKVGETEVKTGETGLDLFGHNVMIWYNAKDIGAKRTYAIFDRATKTAVVEASALDLDDPTAANSISKAAAGEGFTGMVDGTSKVAVNTAFDRFLTEPEAAVAGGDKSPVDLYALISNTGTNLDVVIALNIQTSEIRAEDNVSAVKTVTVVDTSNSTDFNADCTLNAGSPANMDVIEQGALLPGSTKSLGDYEFGIHVNGTNGSYVATTAPGGQAADGYDPAGTLTSTAYFKLHPVDEPITVTITSYNANTGKLTLSDGKTLDKSLYYDTVQTNTIPQVDFASTAVYEYGTYNVWLDYEGKYLGAKLTFDNSFIYGTYMDYSQETSSGSFNYYFTGVNLNGEKVTVPVVTKTYIPDGMADPETRVIGATDGLDVPYRTGNAINNGIGEGIYKGWVVNGTDAADTAKAYRSVNIQKGNRANFAGVQNPVIDSTAVALGAIQVNDGTSGTNLYWTNDTTIILVSGYGTSDLKVEKFEGLDDLMSNYRTVEIQWDKYSHQIGFDDEMAHIKGGTLVEDMTYYTSSPFVYAQTGATGYKMDTVIMPAAALIRNGANNLYYVGDPTPTLVNTTGEGATQFTMYKDGVKQSVWVEGIVDGFGKTTGSGSAKLILGDYAERPGAVGADVKWCDQFFYLTATSRTANDGSTIYKVDEKLSGDATASEGVITFSQYQATTYSSQAAQFTQSTGETNAWATAPLTQALRNVAGAKVVNVNLELLGEDDSDWPGVNDLVTLNEAGSLNAYGGGAKLYVTAILDADNPMMVDYIYVCFNQADPT